MCGIVGILGKEPVAANIVEALRCKATGEAKTIYFIVDTTDYTMAGAAYEVEVRRDLPSGAGSAK